MKSIAVLFARADSVYKQMPRCDVFDFERDALTFPGCLPVIAHPPCRSWGRLRHMAKPRPGERELALWAVDQVRAYGGVLEHPAGSLLWKEKPLPEPGTSDAWGGWTLTISQWWWGHKADKATRLYICGVSPDRLPSIPFRLGEPEFVVAPSRLNRLGKKIITKPEREATPLALAEWLCQVAALCRSPSRGGIAA